MYVVPSCLFVLCMYTCTIYIICTLLYYAVSKLVENKFLKIWTSLKKKLWVLEKYILASLHPTPQKKKKITIATQLFSPVNNDGPCFKYLPNLLLGLIFFQIFFLQL